MKLPYLLVILVAVSSKIIAQKPFPLGSTTLPTGFLKNVGQVRDFDNHPVDFIFYQANIREQQVYITSYGLSILLARPTKITRISNKRAGQKPVELPVPSDSSAIVSYEMERIDIVLKNGHVSPQHITTRVLEGAPAVNMYIDNDKTGANELHVQNEVLIQNVYPGIDWKLYIQHTADKTPSLKYDFIVHPGADPSNIQLQYSNNAKLALTANELTAGAKMGCVKEEKPYSYIQENQREVHVNYQVTKNTLSFQTGEYERSAPLPVFTEW